MDKRRKAGKAKERKEKVKRGKDEKVNGQGGKKPARPHTGPHKGGIVWGECPDPLAGLQVVSWVINVNTHTRTRTRTQVLTDYAVSSARCRAKNKTLKYRNKTSG